LLFRDDFFGLGFFLLGFRVAFMSALIASSKLNGWSETGFAFGIVPPGAAQAARSWDDTSSENALPAAFSASCYYFREDVLIRAVVIPELKFRHIERQIFLADFVERADYTTLEDRPESFNCIGMDCANHIFPLRMIDHLVRILFAKVTVTHPLIGHKQAHLVRHGFTHESGQVIRFDRLNDASHDIALALNGSNHHRLSRSRAASFPVPRIVMAILRFAANKGFIDFDLAYQLRKVAALHGCSNPVAHIPGRPIVAAPNLAMDLQGTNALLALGHQVNDLKPRPQGVIGILKDGLGNDRKPIPIPSAAIFMFAYPMKWAGLQCIDFLALTARALHTIRPTHLFEELLTGLFRREARHQLREGHGRFDRHGIASLHMAGFYPILGRVSSAT